MTCNVSETTVERLLKMTDKQIIEYAESKIMLEGRELVLDLVNRLRSKKSEIYHLTGKLDNVVSRHTCDSPSN